MHRSVHPDGVDGTARALRSPSISSDVMSTSTRSINSTVPFALPLPAFVAQTEASKLISSELDRNVALSPSALALLNDFLDHVLYTILSTARSLSLGALRAAVPTVLKPRLGKAAVRVAEEELREYLDDEDDVESSANKGLINFRHDFDVELAWKLARLRCMVYTRLGDLEEEDEEEWLEKEQLLGQTNMAERPKQGDVVVDPPSAIFLTSIIEYLGEQSLYYAAQHAQKRHDLKQSTKQDDNATSTPTLTPKTDDITLDGRDMNYVGRDSPLSRLWRSWRRNTRETGSRAMSPETGMLDSPAHSRAGSYGRPFPLLAHPDKDVITEVHSPRYIPLPITDRDIDEIEIPGLASALSDSEDDAPEVPDRSHRRPASMVSMPGAFPASFSWPRGQPEQELDLYDLPPGRPAYTRERSMSSPTPSKGIFSIVRTGRSSVSEHIAEADVEHSETEPEAIPSELNHATVEGAQLTTSSDPPAAEESDTTAPAPSAVASRRERIPSQDQGTIGKRAGMVGGAIAVAVGALGANAAAAAVTSNIKNREAVSGEGTSKSHETKPATTQKRTVAEEILGTGSAVPPPKDAATGSSITNVADFDRIYVPVRMEPEVSQVAELDASPLSSAALVPPKASTNPIYGQNEGTRSAAEARHTGYIRSTPEKIIDHNELYGDVPTPTLVAEQSKTLTYEANRYDTTGYGDKKTILSPGPSATQTDSLVSPLPTVPFDRETSNSNVSSTSDDTVAARQAPLSSNPTKHTHTDSKSSVASHHSKSSSSSSRLLGFTRDAQGRPQTISQQRASGGMTEDTRAAHSSTPTGLSRDGRPETANSSTSKIFGKHHKHAESVDEFKKKSLEVLIRSNETLHYTLTPTTVMKEDESFITAKNRTETQDMADFIRNTGPPEPASGRVQRSDIIPPISTMHDVVTLGAVKAIPPAQRVVIPSSQGIQQSASSVDRPRNPLGQPRDARPEHSSTIRDLADYARSTGPVAESQLPRALSPRPPVTNKTSTIPTNSNKPANRSKLQARDPRPSRRAETTDLIDFIREGPPRAAGEHRIDRKVAPFRTTMDSEDFNNLIQSSDPDSYPKYSEGGSHEERSGGPSISSQTALLTSNRVVNNAINGTTTSSLKQLTSTGDGLPPRTRTRVKDPYAIDYSDDEDLGHDYGGVPKAQRTEESLIDFLRNTAPPPGMETQPILSVRPGNAVSPLVGERALGTKLNGAREASPHLTQTGSKIDKYKPTQPTHAAHVDKSRFKPRFEARDPMVAKKETSDLAEYLRTSGPPPSANNKQASGEKDSGLFKMFSKKKSK